MREITKGTLEKIIRVQSLLKESYPDKVMAYRCGGRKAAIVDGGGTLFPLPTSPVWEDVSPEEWLYPHALAKRLELSYIQRMIAGEE